MDLYIKSIHSGIAYFVLAILIIATLNAIRGMASKKAFGSTDLKMLPLAFI